MSKWQRSSPNVSGLVSFLQQDVHMTTGAELGPVAPKKEGKGCGESKHPPKPGMAPGQDQTLPHKVPPGSETDPKSPLSEHCSYSFKSQGRDGAARLLSNLSLPPSTSCQSGRQGGGLGGGPGGRPHQVQVGAINQLLFRQCQCLRPNNSSFVAAIGEFNVKEHFSGQAWDCKIPLCFSTRRQLPGC